MSLEEALTAVEQHIEQVSGALLSLDAPALETASTALRDAAKKSGGKPESDLAHCPPLNIPALE